MVKLKQIKFQLPNMILQREDVEKVIGEKAKKLTDNQMKKITNLMTKHFMLDWPFILRCTIIKMKNAGKI